MLRWTFVFRIFQFLVFPVPHTDPVQGIAGTATLWSFAHNGRECCWLPLEMIMRRSSLSLLTLIPLGPRPPSHPHVLFFPLCLGPLLYYNNSAAAFCCISSHTPTRFLWRLMVLSWGMVGCAAVFPHTLPRGTLRRFSLFISFSVYLHPPWHLFHLFL